MTSFGPLDSRTASVILAALLILEAIGITAIVAAERTAQRADIARMSIFQTAGPAWIKRVADGQTGKGTPQKGERAGLAGRKRLAAPILVPPTLTPHEAALAPDEIVIGVVGGGEARAYRFASFESKSGHLVNDLVGGVPVSVAYCDMTECLRVYTGPRGAEPLNLNVAGVLNNEMIMRYANKMYFHKSGNEVEPGADSPTLPFSLITPTVTTWKEWTARHPDTRVYIGPSVLGQ